MNPGDDAGDCLRCGATTTAVGYGTVVLGVHCDHCELTVTMDRDTVSLAAAQERYDDDHDRERAYREYDDSGQWGPDPWA